MNDMRRFTPYYIICILLFTGCVSDAVQFDGDDWSPSLEARYVYIENTSMVVSSTAGTCQTYVEAVTTPWEFTGQAPWLSISPSSGVNDAGVTITAEDYFSGDNLRSSVFWLSSTASDYEYSVPVTVTQNAAEPYLNVSESNLTMSALGDNKTVTVEKNIEYSVTNTASDWLSVTPSADYTKLAVEAQPNPTAGSRKATITLSGVRTQVINVTQEASEMTSTEYGPLSIDNGGGTYSMQIVSDAAWTASTNGDSWFDVTPSEGETGTTPVVLSVSPNMTTSSRTGKAIFKIGSQTIFSVQITQEGLHFSVSPTSISLGANADSRTLEVSSNTDWKVISKPSWVTSSVSSGSGNGSLTISVPEQTEREARSGTMTIGVEGVTGLQKSIKITQSKHYFSVSPSAGTTLPSTGGTHKVSINTDDNWTASKDATWLSLSSASGQGEVDVTISASDNASVKERNGVVTFTPSHATQVEIPIKQAARYLSVSNTGVSFYWRGGESQPVAVTTDGRFSVTSNATWLKVKVSGNSFTLTADEYDALDYRTAVVTVSLSDLPSDESYNIEIPVVQRGTVPIDISPFPSDESWDMVGNSHATITVTGFAADELWDLTGNSSISVSITCFGQDVNWNQ